MKIALHKIALHKIMVVEATLYFLCALIGMYLPSWQEPLGLGFWEDFLLAIFMLQLPLLIVKGWAYVPGSQHPDTFAWCYWFIALVLATAYAT